MASNLTNALPPANSNNQAKNPSTSGGSVIILSTTDQSKTFTPQTPAQQQTPTKIDQAQNTVKNAKTALHLLTNNQQPFQQILRLHRKLHLHNQ